MASPCRSTANCTGDGRSPVHDGPISFFQLLRSFRCQGAAYVRALQGIVFSPWQGQHILDGKLRVCKSACDAVFNARGLSRGNLTVVNQSYFCAEKTGVEVVDSTDADDCLSLIRPNFQFSEPTQVDDSLSRALGHPLRAEQTAGRQCLARAGGRVYHSNVLSGRELTQGCYARAGAPHASASVTLTMPFREHDSDCHHAS